MHEKEAKCIHCGCSVSRELYTSDLKEFECINCLYEIE